MRKPLLFLTLCTSAVAFAQGGPGGPRTPQPRPLLLALDLDKNGELSAAEIDAATASILTLDKNGDGILTQDEFLPRSPGMSASADEQVALLMSFDKNNDGVLTTDELPARMQGMFTRGDRDHDGKLTADEIRRMAGHRITRESAEAKPGSATGILVMDFVINAIDVNHDGVLQADEIKNAPAALRTLDLNHDGILQAEEIKVRPSTPKERAAHMLEEWDTDKDGKIAKAEAPDRMQERFDAIDLNHDGFLTPDELEKFFSNPANMMRRPGGEGRPNGETRPNSQEKK